MIKSMTISKDEPVLYYQTTREASNQNEQRALLVIHEFKITNHNYRSTILSTYPSKSSTNLQLVPSNPQQILDEIFSPHFHNLLLQISSHFEDEIRMRLGGHF